MLSLLILMILIIVVSPSLVPTLGSSSISKIQVFIYRDLPPDIHRIFNVSILFQQFHRVKSALMVYLVNKTSTSNQLLDSFLFFPGSQSRIKSPVMGTFMCVLFCESRSSNRTIEIHLSFNDTSQDQSLLMYYSEEYSPLLGKVSARLILEKVVSCRVSARPHIDLHLGRGGVNEPAFRDGDTFWVNCTSKAEHEPLWRGVTLEGLDEFDILGHTLDTNYTQGVSVYTSASIKHHHKSIICRSMDHFKTRTILIYHHPVSVLTIPKINPWSKIPYNVSILCEAVGGYPPPIISWEMRIGPINASRFYSLSNNKRILIIHDSAPPGSKWIFDCLAKNSIPSSIFDGPMLSVSFNVPELTIQSRKVVIVVVPIIMVILIVIFSLVKRYFFQKAKIEKFQVSFLMKSPQEFVGEDENDTSDIQSRPHSENLERRVSSTYSIEAGIDHQTLFVLDENRNLWLDQNGDRSQHMEDLHLKMERIDDISSQTH